MDRGRGLEGFRREGRGQEAGGQFSDDHRGRAAGWPGGHARGRFPPAARLYTPSGCDYGPGGQSLAPLVAIAGQRQIALYNTDSAELAGVLPFPEGIPYSLRFSRSGKLLLAGGGKAASRGLAAVYDVRTGKRLSQVGDELDAVLAADINAGQTLIALGGPQKIVRVFNVADGSPVTEIRKHTDWVTAVEFSPDGVLLATADRAGGVWVWEAGTDRGFTPWRATRRR